MATAEARAKKTLKVIESIDQRLSRLEAHFGLGPADQSVVSPEQASELNRNLTGEPASPRAKGGK